MKVLIAEDDQILAKQLRLSIHRILPSAEVTVANSEAEAASVIQSSRFDFAIIDLFLQTHMTLEQNKILAVTEAEGPRLAKTLKRISPNAYVIVTSASRDLPEESLSTLTGAFGVDEFIVKNMKVTRQTLGWRERIEQKALEIAMYLTSEPHEGGTL